MKFLLRILCLTIFLLNSVELSAKETDNKFHYIGVGPSAYGFNDKFEEYLGTDGYYMGFYMELGRGVRRQGDRVHIGSERSFYLDVSVPGRPAGKLRDDYRRLFIVGINWRYAWTFGKGNLVDPLFLPFAGLSIGWHWAGSIIANDFSSGYESGTDIGFGLFGGFEVKVNKRHKINIVYDFKGFTFKGFQGPSYKMAQCGILVSYKLFQKDKMSNY